MSKLKPRDLQILRYPGGKAKLASNPAFQTLIDSLIDEAGDDTFYEGFYGSGAVTLDVAIRHPELKLVGSELDSTIFSFWKLISDGTNAE
jgi:site-specific DNA-adenine methylase